MLILCMFIGINRVDAATGLYCIYDDGANYSYKMLIQDTKGNVSVYNASAPEMLNNSNISLDSFMWIKKNAVFNFDGVSSGKKDSNDDLIDCPEYFGSNEGIFTDDKGFMKFRADLLSDKSGNFSDQNLSSDDFAVATFAASSSYNVDQSSYKIDSFKEQWLVDPIYEQSCLYSFKKSPNIYGSIQLDINFSSKKIRISSAYANPDGNIFLIPDNIYTDYNFSFLERYFKGTCPISLYGFPIYQYDQTLGRLSSRLYFSYNSKTVSDVKDPAGVTSVQTYYLSLSKPEVSDLSIKIDSNIVKVENCDDLLGEELIGLLKGLVNAIKILIPIILIVLGIVDFTQAVFGSKEDDMKKVSSKFIKRVVIAVIIFFIPSFLEILLSIASSIWGNIDPSLCGIL